MPKPRSVAQERHTIANHVAPQVGVDGEPPGQMKLSLVSVTLRRALVVDGGTVFAESTVFALDCCRPRELAWQPSRPFKRPLFIAWIRVCVICFGNRPTERCYRAVLTTEGPPEAFAVEADRVQPAVDAYASFLNGLAYPIQVLVRALPIDLASYARRLEDRAADLPPTLAASARADAVWARQTGPGLGLLDRRASLVLPADRCL
jgi:hypothetical protein